MASKSWIRRLFAQKKSSSFLKGAKPKRAVQIPLDIELLEIRQLLSVTANFASGTLTLTDTNAALTNVVVGDAVSGGNTYVFAYDKAASAFLTIGGSGPVSVTLPGGGSATGVLASSVTQVTYAGGSSTFNEIMTLNGGATNAPLNTLTPYTGTGSITAGSGNNTLIGGAGNDVINGGNGGTNAFSGAGGANLIFGGPTPSLNTIFESSTVATTFTMLNQGVSLSGGQGADAFSNVGTVNLLGGAGNDTFDASAYSSNTVQYIINGGTVVGTDVNQLIVGTSVANDNMTLAVNTFSQTAGGAISFSNIQHASLTGASGNNVFNISGFGGGLTAPDFGRSSVSIDGNGGTDTVISAGIDYPSFALNDTSLTLGNGTVSQIDTLTNINQASLAGATANDSFSLSGWTGAATIVGGSGANNSLTGPDVTSTWNFTSPNNGTINNAPTQIVFSQIKNFTGGSANDTFNLANDAAPTGKLNGGGGTLNVLSFATFDQNISVSLNGNAAVTNFQSIAGGTGNNSITGGTGDDFWTINNSDSGSVVNSGVTTFFSKFGNVFAGTANDTFNFTANGSLSGALTGNGGSGGTFSTLTYNGYNSAVAVNISGIAAPPVGASGTATAISAGFSKITSFVGSAQNDSLTASNTASRTWHIPSTGNENVVSNGATIGMSSFESLTGSGANDDTFAFPNGPNGVSVDGGGGNNTLDYTGFSGNLSVSLSNAGVTGGANIQNVIGGSGRNIITGNPTTQNFWTINGANSGYVTFGGTHNDTFSNFQDIAGGFAGDDFGFSGSGSIAGNVGGSGGANEVLDFNPPAGSFGQGVTFTITGGTSSTVAGFANAGIGQAFAGITSLIGSSHNDTLSIPGGSPMGIDWNVTGADSGNVVVIGNPFAFPFTSIESLSSTGVPSSGHNTFDFTNGNASLTGTVTGSGNDILDYTGYNHPVTVNFDNHSATAIFGQQPNGFSGIGQFIGNGNGTTVSGSDAGFNTFSINTPGAGNDVVTNTGNNAVIGGFTFSNVGSITGGSQGNAYDFTSNASSLNGSITGIGNDTLSLAGHQSGGVAINITNFGTNDSTSTGSFVGFSGNLPAGILGGNFSGIDNIIGTGLVGHGVGDTLRGAAGSSFNVWDLTGNDSAEYFTFGGDDLSYSHISNITGGNSTNGDFFLVDGGSVSGNLDGGPQATPKGVLSYDPETGPILVTLNTISSGTASFIGGEFLGIAVLDGENETGGTNLTNVTLVGPSANHNYTWDIVGPNAGTITGAGGVTFTFQNVGNLTSGSNTTGPSNDTFVFHHNAGVDDNIAGTLTGGAGNDTANYSAFTGNQTVSLGVSVINIDTIIGGSGNNTIIGANASNNWLINGANSGTVTNGSGVTTFSNFANVTGNATADDFAFTSTGSLRAVNGGGGSPEQLDFSNHVTAVHVVLTNVDAGNGTVGPITGGFTGIHSLIGTGNGTFASNDSLTGDNGFFNIWDVLSNDSGFFVNVDVIGGTGFGPFFGFQGIANLQGGTGIDDVLFAPNAQLLGTVDGGTGLPNTLDFSSVLAPVNVNLQNKSATPIFGGQNNGFANFSTYIADFEGSTLTGQDIDNDWTIFGDGAGNISNVDNVVIGNDPFPDQFIGFTNLNGGLANDIFTMSADGGTQGKIDGHVWGGSNGSELNNGSNQSGHDTLGYDSLYGGAVSVNLACGSATGINGGLPGGIASIDALSLSGSNNTLAGNNFIVNAHNAGTVDGVPFSNVQSLVGSAGVDTFTFTNNGSLDGTITGDAASAACNSLSYAGYNAAVTNVVDLGFDTASHINANGPGGFSNITNFTGSANSALDGVDEDSTWTFTSSADGTVSGTTPTAYSDNFHNFTTLQGGFGNDTFIEHANTQFTGRN